MFLNTHSFFSFRYGVMSPRALLQEAQRLGIATVTLTDINGTSGCLQFVKLAAEYGIRPLIGVDFRNGIQQQFVSIAKNNEGFQEINSYLSHFLHQKKEIPETAPDFQNIFVIYPFYTQKSYVLKENEYIGISTTDILKIPFSKSKDLQHKMVIMQTASFRHQLDFNIHRLLRAIDNNMLLSKLPKTEEGDLHHQLCKEGELLQTFKDYPSIIDNTIDLVNHCNISFEFGNGYPHKNIHAYNPSTQEDRQHLRRLCLEGMPYRYQYPNIKIYRRLALELDIIKKKDFVSYFLVNWDILKYARSKGYFYVGRGSGANSIVAYLLRITDVDPIELDLYFERFINLYRTNPPDFDIDFSWRDRNDITRYIFEKFGYERVCLVATYHTFKFKAVTRELGKVFGLPTHEIDKIAEGHYDRSEPLTNLIIKYATKMDEIPSHLSVHASGIIISEKPIHYYTATSLPPKGFPITHFDMVVAEDAGLYKFDILSQRGLEKIKDALSIIQENHPEDDSIDIHDTKRFFEDEKVKDLLRNGNAIGCFYVESPAMRMLLKKLKADNYLGLVAASSIIRPGVAKSGMMRQYILRFRLPEKRAEAHPTLLSLMPETYGVMVYQEDVIKVAHYFAGLSLGEADLLRRGMSGKFRSRTEFQQVKQKFFVNCIQKGHGEELTADVWRQVESFAGYAFAKGHSASYAIESYQSLYLKAHYPLEYMVAVINNGGGFYSRQLYIHEARMQGANIEAPCINRSQIFTTISGTHIYLGFHIIHELDHHSTELILQKRKTLARFNSLEQFINEVALGIEQVKILIRLGVFRDIEINKKKLLWKAHFLLNKQQKPVYSLPVFPPSNKPIQLPSLDYDQREDSFDELEILHFTLKSPFELIKARPVDPIIYAEEIETYKDKIVTMLGYLVTVKRTSTNKGDRMHFGTFLDEKGRFIDTVHFPSVARTYPFRGHGLYELTGKVVEEFGFYTLEITQMIRSNYINMEDVKEEDEILTLHE
ncbi:DNA polymerase III subunit alpha [Reichenbachiella agarivorans]|uniref:DNA polymerase III subunit alpha n=1 Tax=Reichenbachiella agarivorans TaxID=2979464 RepID=A0ABY6CSP7_9BACT|nr:DNA polymerase III subunit alpha [Reichenbachiella agarivorans]UXP33546.1 DNA polymerase III subunit alpha [Reichenbachiella agarivorans]